MSEITSQQFDELHRIIKTHGLIEALANAGANWTEADVRRAAQETGSCIFSLADVSYMRFIQNDAHDKQERDSISYLCKEMSRMEEQGRAAFYRANIMPHVESQKTYRAAIRRQFDGLVFYADR